MCRILFVVAFGLVMSCQVVVEPDYDMSITCECLNMYNDRGELKNERCLDHLTKSDVHRWIEIEEAANEEGFVPNVKAYHVLRRNIENDPTGAGLAYCRAMMSFLNNTSVGRNALYTAMLINLTPLRRS